MTHTLNDIHGIDVCKAHKTLARGCERRTKKTAWPFEGRELVEFKVRTVAGIASSGVVRAHLFEQSWNVTPPDEIGGIVGWRIMPSLRRPAS